MKRRNLLSIALLLLLVAVTTLTFAYWDQLTANDDKDIEIGEGQTIVVNGVVDSELKLIPTTAVLDPLTDVYEITVTYTITLNKVNASDKVKVTLTSLTVDEDTEHAGLVNVLFGEEEVVEDEFVELTAAQPLTLVVTFTLNEPANEEDYNAVANKEIAYSIEFTYVKSAE